MRASLNLGGTFVEFTPKTAENEPYPYLLSVGTLRVAARAGKRSGLGVGESPSLAIVLNNNERQTAPLIGNPLRAAVTVYNDDSTIFFAGVVSRVTHGRTITLSIGN